MFLLICNKINDKIPKKLLYISIFENIVEKKMFILKKLQSGKTVLDKKFWIFKKISLIKTHV